MFSNKILNRNDLGLLCYCLDRQKVADKITMHKLSRRFPGRTSLKKSMDKLLGLGYAIRYPEKRCVPRSIVYKFFEEPLTTKQLEEFLDQDED